jgi:hypothetical protein
MYHVYKKTLNFIFNESISQGVSADFLKTEKIRPVFKKGNRQEISNYTPICFISIFSKNFRKNSVYNRLVSFISKFKILTVNQYGFQKNK